MIEYRFRNDKAQVLFEMAQQIARVCGIAETVNQILQLIEAKLAIIQQNGLTPPSNLNEDKMKTEYTRLGLPVDKAQVANSRNQEYRQVKLSVDRIIRNSNTAMNAPQEPLAVQSLSAEHLPKLMGAFFVQDTESLAQFFLDLAIELEQWHVFMETVTSSSDVDRI